MPVIADSSVLITLAKVDLLHLLRDLYGRVLMPPAVYQEVVLRGSELHKPEAYAVEDALTDGWAILSPLPELAVGNAQTYRARAGIGSGEAEAIALAADNALPLLLDDRNARRLAESLGLEYLGTAAVLLEGRLAGILDEPGFLAHLRSLGRVLWLSPDVIADLIARSGRTL